jgi:four helix bundle protein
MAEGFEKLIVWQKAHALKLFIHRMIVPRLPPVEKWDLSDQIRRSSKSVTANIAEGYGRFYYREAVRFCYNARGSLCETQNHLIDARDLQYIAPALYQQARDISDEVYRLINGYIGYLKKQRPGASEPGHDIHTDQPSSEETRAQSLIPNP